MPNDNNSNNDAAAAAAAAASTTAAAASAAVAASLHDYYLTATAAMNVSNSNPMAMSAMAPPSMLPPDFSAFFMGADAGDRSIPGSPSMMMSNLGFHSIQGSPILGPSLPQSPAGIDTRHSFTNLAALVQQQQQQQHQQQQQRMAAAPFLGFESSSAVQSATASPITGAVGRRGLLNSMASLNMAQLPPAATAALIGSQSTAAAAVAAAAAAAAASVDT
ncbi:hypothetical protein LPJ73_007508, partial [Coemansia sp. RSA 2703]